MGTYAEQLNADFKRKYYKKIQEIGEDPYEAAGFVENFAIWPNVTYFDLCNYLVYSSNSVTQEQMKSYKSLEAHNYLTSGFVNNKILVKKTKQNWILFRGEVKHSQTMNAAALKVWVLAKEDGEIKTAHCTCMAGQGESCSHIGALLFAIITKIQLELQKTSTDKENMWLQPNTRNSLYKRVAEIDFSSAGMKKKRMFEVKAKKSVTKKKNISPPTEKELSDFYKAIAKTGYKSAILSLMPEHQHMFKPDRANLKTLFNEKYKNKTFSEVIQIAKDIFFSDTLELSKELTQEIEEKTIKQSHSVDWYRYRTGRITASVMKSACVTDAMNPSMTLINKICYPKHHKFQNAATIWGCSHEKNAFDMYVKRMQDHEAFVYKKAGLCINPKYAHLGATPDGHTRCNCCGNGVVEIKCPFCIKDSDINDYAQLKNSCLKIDEAGNINLCKQHSYYYQIQTQLHLCDADFCDFIVWTEKDLHIERIFPDNIFWEDIEQKSELVFVYAILPELMIQWFSKNKK